MKIQCSVCFALKQCFLEIILCAEKWLVFYIPAQIQYTMKNGPSRVANSGRNSSSESNNGQRRGRFNESVECDNTTRTDAYIVQERGPWTCSGISVPSGIADPTRTSTIWHIVLNVSKLATIWSKKFNTNVDYTDGYNSWVNGVHGLSQRDEVLTYSLDGGRTRQYKVKRQIEIKPQGEQTTRPLIINASIVDSSLKRAKNTLAYTIMQKVLSEIQNSGADMYLGPEKVKPSSVVMPKFQSDEERPVPTESIQGSADQLADVAQNTTITRDTTQTLSVEVGKCRTQKIASTEAVHKFPALTNRFMPLQNFSVTSSNAVGTEVVGVVLPLNLYTLAKCAPNIAPFEAFAYVELEVEVKIVMNANKFQAGKLVASYRCDCYQATDVSDGVMGSLTRPHVILDLSTRNEGVLKIPWKFHTPFMRVVQTKDQATAAQSGQFVQVSVKVLSPLNVSTDASTVAYGQVFYRVTKANFTGMSYRVSFQSDVDQIVQSVLPLKTIKAIASGIEHAATQMGSSINQDRPNNPVTTTIVPKPRSMFSNVKGVGDATTLRPSADGLTSFGYVGAFEGDPQSPTEAAQIWGLRTTAPWKAADAVGTRILTQPVSLTREQRVYTAITPLEYFAGMFAFTTGTIELRFDFISTAFHQGSVMASIEYNRPVPSGTTDLCSTASTYTKTFHLGEQKSFNMVVPYIYDTAQRRTNGTFQRLLCTSKDYPNDASDLTHGLNLAQDVHTYVRLTVVNQLKPVQSVASEIQVLMFWRAGPDFKFTGLKQCDFSDYIPTQGYRMKNLPLDFLAADGTPTAIPKIPIGAVRVQVDTGEKESEDATPSFVTPPKTNCIQNMDEEMDFKDILRRKTMIVNSVDVPQTYTFSGTQAQNGFFIPVRPVSRDWVSAAQVATETNWCAGGILSSPSTAIVNCFRFWKGSNNYDMYFQPGTGCNMILVTYVPHSGVTKIGAQTYPTNAKDGTRAVAMPFMSGYATEIVIPSVNPTTSVIAPYETENDWTLCWESNPELNYTWRDKGNTNAGHIVIQSMGGPCKATVWWSAGDDFQLSNFYGMSYVANEAFAWRMYENGTFPSTDSEMTSVEIAAKATKTMTSRLQQQQSRVPPVVTPPPASPTPSTEFSSETEHSDTEDELVVDSNPAPAVVVPGSSGTSGSAPDVQMSDQADLPHTRVTNPRRRAAILKRVREEEAQFPEYYSKQQKRNWLTDMMRREFHVNDPSMIPHFQADEWHDAEQQGFRFTDAVTSVTSVFKSLTPRALRNVALSAVPIVGTSAAVALTTSEVADDIQKKMAKFDDVPDKVNLMLDTATESMAQCTDKMTALSDRVGANMDVIVQLLQNATSGLDRFLTGFAHGSSVLFDMLLDVFIAWYDKSWMAVGVGVVRMLCKTVPGLVITSVMHYGQALGEAIAGWVTDLTVPAFQVDVSKSAEVLIALLAGLVGTIIGVTIDTTQTSFAMRLIKRMTASTGIMYFVHMINFIRNIFGTVQEMVMWAMGRVSPEAAALEALSGKSEELQEFVKNAQDLTCEANFSLLSMPAFRVRAWKTVMQAYQLQRLMTLVPNNVVSPVVNKLCTEVIKVGNEKFLDMASCPVKYEPFVICLEGSTAIGKSHMTESLVTEMLQQVGYTASNVGLAYYRQPGSEYWSGYRDQPVVVFDEWMQCNEQRSQVTQMSELFQLKTTAPFIPNMAHLEEKKIRANPLIVVLLTNNAFPTIDTMNTPSAALRRRDLVIKAEKIDRFAGVDVRDMDQQVRENYEHLVFRVYGDPTDRESLDLEPFDYAELKAYINEGFQRYHEFELESVRKRMQNLFSLNRHVPPALLDIRDPFKLFYSTQVEPAEFMANDDVWVTSERLHRDAEDIYRQMVAGNHEEMRRAIDPEVQAQSPVTTLVKYSYVLWSYFFKLTGTGCRMLGEYLHSSAGLRGIVAECVVCRQNKRVSKLCTNEARHYRTTNTVRHACCDDCFVADRLVNPHVPLKCPTCRDENFTPLLSEEEYTWYNRTIVLLGSGQLTVASWMEQLSRMGFMFADVTRVFDMLFLCMSIFCGLPIGAVPVVATGLTIYAADYVLRGGDFLGVGGNPLVPFTDRAPIHRYLPDLQADDDGVVFLDAEEMMGNPRRMRVRDPARDQRRAEMLARVRDEVRNERAQIELVVMTAPILEERGLTTPPEVPSALCLHATLTPGVRFLAGWQTMVNGVSLTLPEGVCCDTCVWVNNLEAQVRFYNAVLQQQRFDLQASVVRWVSGVPGQREVHLRGIPKCVQPPWMYNPLLLDAQARQATSATWWEYVTDLLPNVITLLKISMAVVAACGVLCTGYAAYSWMFTPGTGPTLPIRQPPVDAGTVSSITDRIVIENQSVGESIRHHRPQPIRRGPPVRSQAAEIDLVVETYILRNTVTIVLTTTTVEGTKRTKVLHGLGIAGHSVLIPRHYLSLLRDPYVEIQIGPTVYEARRQVYTYDRKDFVELGNNDMAIWTWPRSTNAFKDIRSFFVTEEDLVMRPLPANATLYIVPSKYSNAIHAAEVRLAGCESSFPVMDEAGQPAYIKDVLVYNYSRPGACGSMLVVGSSQRPILGMHVAGAGDEFSGSGYALIITQEVLRAILPDEIHVTRVPSCPDIEVEDIGNAKIVLDEEIQVNYVGAKSQSDTPHSPRKTKLVRSSVFGAEGLQADVRPAFMSGHEPGYIHDKSPLVLGVEAHGKLTRDFSTTDMEEPLSFMKELFKTLDPLILKPKKLTLEQAVSGFPDIDYYDPIDLKTSVGYPLMLKGKQKEAYIHVERAGDGPITKVEIDRAVVDMCDEAEKVRKSRKRYPTLWVDTLKDEKRPTAKAMKRGGTRIVCNGPVEHSLSMRRNFMHFSAAFMSQRRRFYHAVGINPVSHEWHDLAGRLINKSSKVVTLDYTNFGPGLNSRVAAAVCGLIVDWTEKHVEGVDRNEMDMLMEEIINSHHIVSNTVYSQNSGAPSGNVLTSLINSMVNIFYILLAWQGLMKDAVQNRGKLVFQEFKKSVCLVVYGDDLIMTVAEPYTELFTAVTISQFFADYGIVATDALKTGTVVPYTSLENSEFLKRTFVWHPWRQLWMSKLRDETIVSTTQWVWSSPNVEASTSVNCEVALMNAHGHGQKKFDEYKEAINTALAKRKIDPIMISWKEIDEMIYDKGVVDVKWNIR